MILYRKFKDRIEGNSFADTDGWIIGGGGGGPKGMLAPHLKLLGGLPPPPFPPPPPPPPPLPTPMTYYPKMHCSMTTDALSIFGAKTKNSANWCAQQS